MGNSANQQNSINWSNLILGSVALKSTKIKQKIQVFNPNTAACIFIKDSFIKSSGIL